MKTYTFLDLALVNAPYMEALRKASERVLSSGRYIGGKEVEEFEHRLCELVGTRYAVGVSTGLDALRLILEAHKCMGRLAEGDEVIVPANTYIASVLAITQAGLKPVLVDPDVSTMNLDARGISEALTQRTKAVMPVDLYGRLAWNDDMASVVATNELIVVEDAAQAIGVKGICRHGGAAGLSFYPTKNLGALGDGGAVVTDDDELAQTVRALANYGSDYRYHNIFKGFNCRLDPLQAAFLKAKSSDLANVNARRRCRAKLYSELIANEWIVTPDIPSGELTHAWHQYVVRIRGGRRDEFREFMGTNGVETDIHYSTPPHRQPCYSEFSEMALPVAELLANEIVSLPISECTSMADVAEICSIINRFK